MKKLFGKPCKNDGTQKAKFAIFAYYFFIVFYLICAVILLLNSFYNLSFLPFAIIILLIFCLMIRGLYSLVLKLNNLEREN